MKKALSLLLCLILILGCLPLTAMADDTELGSGGETGISLTTGVPELASITVTPPNKTEYYVGDELNTAGMTVKANYNYTDDTPKDVTSAATLSGFDSSTAGTVTVTVSYTEGTVTKTDTFTVTISNVPTTTYTVSVSADPSVGGTVDGGGDYAENATATVTATANSGYSFVRWTENGAEVSTDASYGFTVTGDRTLVAVFEKTYYTVTILPGEGTGDPLTISSTTILTNDQARGDGYNKKLGCFYYHYSSGDIEYKYPLECAFTAPPGKEFDCWLSVKGNNHNAGAELPLWATFADGSKDTTIVAVWKDVVVEPDPSITLSIPATINVEYGATQTPVEITVTAVSFTKGMTEAWISLIDSEFKRSEGSGSIPFIIDVNGEKRDNRDGRAWNSAHGDFYFFHYREGSGLSDTLKASINISNDAWEAATPGRYTATLRIYVNFA